MKVVVEISEKDYDLLREDYNKPRIAVNKFEKAVVDGIVLTDSIMLIDEDRLECDTQWDSYYDGFVAFSPLAIRAAAISVEGERNEIHVQDGKKLY